jgi:hypothetical protein
MDGPGAPNGCLSHSPNAGLPFSPKQFLKMRRPERFSDTLSSTVPALDRAMLEYHLDTLTSRNEELLFEDFAKALLQRTVCPNLLPHTGPSGGGDSKVDSETYPVAPSLAVSWYVGEPHKSSAERWAFSFSAKKKWRPKVQSDVGKVVATRRGYSKAFFVSNQFIRDKVRAEVEDALTKEQGIDVRIFDRTWILDQVFDNKLELVAVDRLHIKTEIRRHERKGPRDTERQQKFDAAEAEITAAIQEGRQSPAIVDNGLLSADLARCMERPRQEVDGLYARAENLANQYGTAHQQLRCAYERAWTSYWWYEDYNSFVQQYDQVERRAQGSHNPYELELWSNLFSCLHVIAQSQASAGHVDSKPRAKLLLESLAAVARDDARPSAALHAKSLSLQVQLLTAEPGEQKELLGRLTDVVQKAEGLIGYPFEPLAKIVTAIGTTFGELPEYQRLFEEALAASTRRTGDVTGARMMVQRGIQQLDSGHTYDAIRMLGRVMGKLFKHESREDAVHALYLCSHAYERVGLLWAARGTALAAASIATNDYWTYETLTPQQAACYNRIKWMELRLGRLGPMLAWHELDHLMRRALTDRGCTIKWVTQDDMFDPITGMLLLKADVETLRNLTSLPEVLDSTGLPMSAVALLFALGYVHEVPSALVGEDAGEEDRRKFFRMWRDQPAKGDLPPQPKLDLTQTIRLESSVAGCRIDVACRNESPCIELGESLLACVEALLATSMSDRIIAREPLVKVKINVGEFAQPPFAFRAEDVDGRPAIEIRCRPFSAHKLSIDEQTKLKERLFEVVAHILARAFLLENPKALLTKLFRDDLAPQRALDFTTSFVVVGNVLGHDARTRFDQWIDSKATNYPLLRKDAWDREDRDASSLGQHTRGFTLAAADSEAAPEVINLNQVSHRQIQTVSLIREAIWNEAEWRGVGFAISPDPSVRPILALLFENAEAGMKIFNGWHDELGDVDGGDRLRIAILRNIRRDKPHWYRIVIGNDPASALAADGVKNVVMVSRIHTMNPDSSENLERFIGAYEKAGNYILTQARLNGSQIHFAATNGISKKRIVIREAWEIGPHDPDSVGISLDDDPIMPQGVQDPPVVRTLERIRQAR